MSELDTSSTDAQHWAEQVIKTVQEQGKSVGYIDVDWLTGWFANFWAAVYDPLTRRIDAQQAKIDALTECIEEMSKDPAPEHPYHEGLRCGVEDREIYCRYEAAEYGWEQAFEYIRSIAVNYVPAQQQEQEDEK